MNSLFSFCENLFELPDISKWDITNVKDKSSMFYMCNKNLNNPDKFKKNLISNLVDICSNSLKNSIQDTYNMIK